MNVLNYSPIGRLYFLIRWIVDNAEDVIEVVLIASEDSREDDQCVFRDSSAALRTFCQLAFYAANEVMLDSDDGVTFPAGNVKRRHVASPPPRATRSESPGEISF